MPHSHSTPAQLDNPQWLAPSETEQRRWLFWARHCIAQHWQPRQHLPALAWANSITDAFISLHKGKMLRGCMGVTGNRRHPWCKLLPHLAHQCAFADPRFKPLQQVELNDCQIDIQWLLTPHKISCANRAQLMAQLNPNQGLILRTQQRQALFLPNVWQQLPQADAFVDALLHKGGWKRMRLWMHCCTKEAGSAATGQISCKRCNLPLCTSARPNWAVRQQKPSFC